MRIKLGELLVQEGLITPSQLDEALVLHKAEKKKLGRAIVELGFVDFEQLAACVSRQLGLDMVDLTDISIDQLLVDAVPLDDAEKYLVFPVGIENRKLVLAMSDPLDHEAIDELQFKSGYIISPVLAPENKIITAIDQNYNVETKAFGLMRSVDSYDDAEFLRKKADKKTVNVQSLYKESEAPPIIKMVTMIIVEAVKMRASDIHIEPREDDVRVRYRIDGDLREVLKLPKKVQEAVVSRIKIISDLDITNRRLPQDGSSKLRLSDREVDLRISTMPSLWGENVVIRLLDKSKSLITLEQLGLPGHVAGPLEAMLRQSQGFVLVTGPTGSGKTTTLYAILQQLKSEIGKVISVEDPVEYRLDGVTQVGVHEAIGLTFASVLRSALRQDPDIIMVGEIRDLETANIAIKSSLTGHLVLSTLHTNDTVSSIVRLLDLGIPSFLVGSSLNGILAQRLVKKLCPNCKEPDPEKHEGLKSAFRPVGCEMCNRTGYYGQEGVFEFLQVESKLRRLIAQGASDDEIRAEAKAQGLRTLFTNAVEKIEQGITSVDEVMVKIPNLRRR